MIALALKAHDIATAVAAFLRLPLNSVCSSASTSGVIAPSPYSISLSLVSGFIKAKLRRLLMHPLSNLIEDAQ